MARRSPTSSCGWRPKATSWCIPTPEGSTTYGQQFGNSIQHRYPGDDHRDLMAALDEVVGRGFVDPARLGVTGGSGGGLLTNWALTRTTRFKAAVSQRSIADWEAWWYSADFTLFSPSWFTGPPWQEQKEFAGRSPITHVDKITTPLMLIDGDVGLPHAAGGWRRGDVPGVEVSQGAGGDGPLSRRGPRAVARRARRGAASIACATSWAGSTSGSKGRRRRPVP